MRTWTAFSSLIRKVVAGAIVITEVIEGVLDDDRDLLRSIILENPYNSINLNKLIRATRKVAKTLSGRIEVRRLAAEYWFEAQWPVDDVSLRRLYEIYRRGELGKRLPDVDRRIAHRGR